MASGIITLDGTKYIVEDPRSIQRSNANQVSARFGQGQSEYDDLIDWVNWVMDDWRAGVSQKDSEAGGSAFSTCETRFEGAISLGYHMTCLSDDGTGTILSPPLLAFETNSASGATEFEVGVGDKIGCVFTIPPGGQVSVVEFVMRNPPPFALVEGEARWMSGGAPGAPIFEAAQDFVQRPQDPDEEGFHWYNLQLIDVIINSTEAARDVLITIKAVDHPLKFVTINLGSSRHWRHNGSSWSNGGNGPMMRILPDIFPADPSVLKVSHVARRVDDGHPYLYSVGKRLFSVDDGGGMPSLEHEFDEDITELFVLGTKLYIGQGQASPYFRADLVEAGIDNLTEMFHPGEFFVLHNGFLWRASGGSAYYTGDDTELFWEQVEVALDENATITGMAGLEGDLIVSTNEGLYRITPGDWVHLITPWGKPSPKNGKGTVAFQGHVYVPLEKSIIRYDAAGILPIGFELGEGLPPRWSGDVVGWAASNNWLIAALGNKSTSSMWTNNGQGWHFLSVSPRGIFGGNRISAIQIDSTEDVDFDAFIVGTDYGHLYRVVVPSSKRPIIRAQARYMPTSWMETPWHFGRLVEVAKDWESVYMSIEPMYPGQRIEIFFQRHENRSWIYFGSITEHGMEIRWEDEDRIEDSHLKFGFVIYGGLMLNSPIIEAIRVKYEPMIPDRWQWSLPITVSPSQQLVDGSIALESTASRLRHLDALIRRVTPFKFVDVDGVEYDAKVVTHNRNVLKLEWVGHQTEVQYIYNLVLKQVTVQNGEDS